MPTISADRLLIIASKLLQSAGANSCESEIVARHCVDANLAGHDSHGIMQIPVYIDRMNQVFGRVIPAHSYIFNSMVTAGILGGAFWIFLTYFIAKNYANYSNYLPFIFHFCIIYYFYSLFFSPWGAASRINLEINLSLLILYIASMESNKSRQQNKKKN